MYKNHIIMLLTNSFNPDVRVYKEAVYLISKGFDLTILCWDRKPSDNLPRKENMDGINVIRFPIESVAGTGMKQLPAYFKYIKQCKKYLKDNKCDYLHCNDIDGAITGYLARQKHTPMVFDMHEFYERGEGFKYLLWHKLVLFLLRKSYAALAVSYKYVEKPYTDYCERIYSLRNYPDKKTISLVPKTESSVFRIGYHGVVRNQVSEFKALFEAVKDMQDVRVDINGGGVDLPELKQLEDHYNNVYIHGPYDGRKESSRLYSETDILFCGYNPDNPNYKGKFEPVKFYEAVVTGTPLIVTSSTHMADVVNSQNYGIACDTRNSDEIRSAIIRMKEDKKFYDFCSLNEIKSSKNYNWNDAVRVLDKVYVH